MDVFGYEWGELGVGDVGFDDVDLFFEDDE